MSPPAYDFSGKVVLVTGAAGGLGRAIAGAFARCGAEVVLVGRTARTLEEAAAGIRQQGGKAWALTCDVTDDAAVERIPQAVPRCDVLVNNAGTNVPQPFMSVDVATLDRLLALNVRSVFRVSQCLAAGMIERGGGVIIHMSSQRGHVGAPRRTVYCMTKHAIEGLTKAMALELAPHGIRVVSIAPTYILTPLTEPFFEDAAFRREVTGAIALGRLGEPDEVAAAVLFAASPQASLLTGTSLVVDGGYTAA